MRQSALSIILLFGLLLAPACSPLGVATTAGAVVGTAALQERGFQQTLIPTTIPTTETSSL